MTDYVGTSARALSVAPSPAFWIAVVMYTAAAATLLLVLVGHTRLRKVALALVVIAFAAHGTDIGWRGVEHVHPAQSVREALGFLAFIITGGYLAVNMRYRLTLGGAAVMPVALVLLVIARLTPAGTAPDDLSALGRIHISLATVGVAVFALASVLSMIYLVEERALRRKKFDTLAFKAEGAPLEALDRLSLRLIWVGLPIFTVSLVLGAIWVPEIGEAMFRPEYALASLTWLFFAGLLVMRQVYGWRGRRAARLTLAGFSAALLVLVIYLVRRMLGAP